jgi:quercetin dioxygenase-like cupin family protein
MKKMDFNQAKTYDAAKHFNCFGLRLQGKEETGTTKMLMNMSHFLPGGGAEFDASPTEKLYFVVSGEVTVTDANKNKIVLKEWDSICIGPNEGRSILNETNKPATMLITINYPS